MGFKASRSGRGPATFGSVGERAKLGAGLTTAGGGAGRLFGLGVATQRYALALRLVSHRGCLLENGI